MCTRELTESGLRMIHTSEAYKEDADSASVSSSALDSFRVIGLLNSLCENNHNNLNQVQHCNNPHCTGSANEICHLKAAAQESDWWQPVPTHGFRPALRAFPGRI